MFPPSQGLRLDIDAISQICGSVSIACWIVVFSPQIIENWKRSSAEGLSVVFITIWLAGDFFNIFGAVLQGVLPTMIILAVYYTLADIVLLLQCFYYNGFTLHDQVRSSSYSEEETENRTTATEESPLLQDSRQHANGGAVSGHTNGYHSPSGHVNGYHAGPTIADYERRHSTHSQHSFRERFLSIDGTHLSPATPLLDDTNPIDRIASRQPSRPQSSLQTVLYNLGIVILVCASGVFGWWLSATRQQHSSNPTDPEPDNLQFNVWGQIFGYICAALYLGSRVPQLLLNYRRKSTDGISMLFFLFACIGNLTYVLSIVAYQPICRKPGHCGKGEARGIYGKYIAVNLSWLLGSFGTLVLDAFVFVQYFLYRKEDESDEETDSADTAEVVGS
ncbi:PQ-loop-domain-containing protein [Lentithecium fluviatile CBS 122367]|uniref:PQ-loop-domain-containing protein n=1 Tax=Lentithecium fluviatile CBS 122367 TaxID=1168545 RepID=A0A6G1J4Z3_9PLEO|nr:PQ-loop-domain-containing protein [Lentithecium fluviatile CBS 122367]